MADFYKPILQELLGGAMPGSWSADQLNHVQAATQHEEEEDMEMGPEMPEDDMELPDEELDLGDEVEEPEDPDRMGVVRQVDNAHLVYKRENEEGTYDELWIYNIATDMKNELEVRRAILAGTDIQPKKTRSEDGSQSYSLSTLGNAQLLYIRGLPQ